MFPRWSSFLEFDLRFPYRLLIDRGDGRDAVGGLTVARIHLVGSAVAAETELFRTAREEQSASDAHAFEKPPAVSRNRIVH
jgi:hypothetical protein